MNALLLSEQFDSFLVEEAIITTYNTFHIDGHLVRDFYTNEELELLESEEKVHLLFLLERPPSVLFPAHQRKKDSCIV